MAIDNLLWQLRCARMLEVVASHPLLSKISPYPGFGELPAHNVCAVYRGFRGGDGWIRATHRQLNSAHKVLLPYCGHWDTGWYTLKEFLDTTP